MSGAFYASEAREGNQFLHINTFKPVEKIRGHARVVKLMRLMARN
jgi:hypothetical protein